MMRLLQPDRMMRRIMVCLLFVVSIAIRIWRGHQFPTVGVDALRYILQGQTLGVDPLKAVRQEVYHPLFSFVILTVHDTVQRMGIGAGAAAASDRFLWTQSAQGIGIFCSAVVALLIFLLARRLGARFWPAMAGAMMWNLGSRTSAYGPDGFADTFELCFLLGSLLAGIEATCYRRRKVASGRMTFFVLAGLLGGLAYLARPEGLAAPLIICLTLWGQWLLSLLPKARMNRPQRWKLIPRRPPAFPFVLAATLTVAVSSAVPALPYMLAIHGFSHKKELFTAPAPVASPEFSPPATSVSPPAPASYTRNLLKWVWQELSKTLGYAPIALLLLPLLWHWGWWGRPRLRLMVIIWATLWCCVMFWLASSYGYLSGRHTLPLVVLDFALLGIALRFWTQPVRAWIDFWRKYAPSFSNRMEFLAPARWPLGIVGALFILMVGVSIPLLFTQPFTEGVAYAQAVQWVHANVKDDVIICDRPELVGYYSLHPYARCGEGGVPYDWEVDRIKTNQARLTGRKQLAIVGCLYEQGLGIQPSIGRYRPIAEFHAPGGRGDMDDIYVLYAAPGDPILKDGKETAFIKLP